MLYENNVCLRELRKKDYKLIFQFSHTHTYNIYIYNFINTTSRTSDNTVREKRKRKNIVKQNKVGEEQKSINPFNSI